MPQEHSHGGSEGFGKYLIPALLSIIGALSVTSVVGLWNLSSDVKVIKSAQHISPTTVAQLEVRVKYLEDSRAEILAAQAKEMDRLRDWMRNHTHGGQVRPAAPREP